jgi:predicted DNA-binding transcriptional regulator AlpA
MEAQQMSMRRLLNTEQVAEKIGYSKDWFIRNKESLFKQGFPRPTLGDKPHGRARFDDSAIDAWLDSRMPKELRNTRAEVSRAAEDWSAVLETRAEGISL